MTNKSHKFVFVSLAALLLAAPACYEDVPNLNGLDFDAVEEEPTPQLIDELAVGLLIGHRAGKGAANGYVAQLGIVGRESFNFDPADPRFRSELLEGQLQGGSPAFGGNFWNLPYRNVKNAFTLLGSLETVAGLSDAEKNVIRGYAQTFIALEFLSLITTRDENGIAIDVNREITAELAPIVTKDQAFDEIERLLQLGCENLGGCPSGDVSPVATAPFTFQLGSGFAGFDTPETFVTFNRAIAARVFAYREKWTEAQVALDQSFLDASNPEPDFKLGAYHIFGTGSGDTSNNLSSVNIYAQPAAVTAAEAGDDRAARKLVHFSDLDEETGGTVQSGDNTYTSDYRFAEFQEPTSPIAIIRQEELFLLQAEVHIGNSDLDAARDTLNIVRTGSGKLAPYGDFANAGAAIDAMLYERRYSLLFEGGHRWVDMRRYEKLDELLADDQNPNMINTSFPIPDDEINARQ